MRSLLFFNFEPKIPKISENRVRKLRYSAGTVSSKTVRYMLSNSTEIISHLKELEAIIRIKINDQDSPCWVIGSDIMNSTWLRTVDFQKDLKKSLINVSKIGKYNNWHVYASYYLNHNQILIGVGNSLHYLSIAKANFFHEKQYDIKINGRALSWYI